MPDRFAASTRPSPLRSRILRSCGPSGRSACLPAALARARGRGLRTAELALDARHVQPLHVAQVLDALQQLQQLGAVEAIAPAGADRGHQPFALPQPQRRRADADDPRGLADGEEAVTGRRRRTGGTGAGSGRFSRGRHGRGDRSPSPRHRQRRRPASPEFDNISAPLQDLPRGRGARTSTRRRTTRITKPRDDSQSSQIVRGRWRLHLSPEPRLSMPADAAIIDRVMRAADEARPRRSSPSPRR